MIIVSNAFPAPHYNLDPLLDHCLVEDSVWLQPHGCKSPIAPSQIEVTEGYIANGLNLFAWSSLCRSFGILVARPANTSLMGFLSLS